MMTDNKNMLMRLTRLIYWVFAALIGVIGLRVLLKLVAANPNNAFARFVYDVTDALLRPFLNLTATPSASGMVLDLPALIGMIVYMLAAWLITRFVWILFGPQPSEPQVAEPESKF